MPTAVSIDGALVAPEHARISVFDRGFLYGDAVVEVLRTYRRMPFALEEHLGRLQRGARAIALSVPVPLGQLREELERVIAQSQNDECYLRVVLTRGAGEPIALLPNANTKPTRVLIAQPLVTPAFELYRNGAAAIVHTIARTGASQISAAKTACYLEHVLATQLARSRGAHEAILVSRDGHVLEGASSNVFIVDEDTLRTPPDDGAILPGITREKVLDCARAMGLTVREEPLREADLFSADEVFVTSSIRELISITRVEDHEVGEGRAGPVARAIHRAFRACTPLGPGAAMPWE